MIKKYTVNKKKIVTNIIYHMNLLEREKKKQKETSRMLDMCIRLSFMAVLVLAMVSEGEKFVILYMLVSIVNNKFL